MRATTASIFFIMSLAGYTMAAPMPHDIYTRELQALVAREPLLCGVLPSGHRINCSGAVLPVRELDARSNVVDFFKSFFPSIDKRDAEILARALEDESGAFSFSGFLKSLLPAIDKRHADILARTLEDESGAFSFSGFLKSLLPAIDKRHADILARTLEDESGAFSFSSLLKNLLPALDKRDHDLFIARALADAESGAFSISSLLKPFFPAIDRRSLYALD